MSVDYSVANSIPSSDVIIEPGDENYLRAGYLSAGYGYKLGEWTDPASGFVRKDWSDNIHYQRWKNELHIIIQEANGQCIEGQCDYSVFPKTRQEMLDVINIVDNLNIDLEKEGIAKHVCLLNNPADGIAHSQAYDMAIVYFINDDRAENIAKYPEVEGYY